MGLLRLAGFSLKGAALWAGLGLAVMGLLLATGGLLAAALFIWVEAHLGAAAAAAITAGALLLLALLLLLAGLIYFHRRKRRAPALFAETTNTIAMLTGMARMLVGRDPKRAILLSLIAGALAEYFMGAE